MSSRYARFLLSGVAASLLAATAAAGQDKPVVVYGEPHEDIRTERVSYADLDLSQRAGQGTLNRRVSGAVKRVCLHDGYGARQDFGYERCADDAWGGARPQIKRAIARAKEIALTGKSSIAATAITIRIGE